MIAARAIASTVAIHLATAVELSPHLDVLVTYDRRTAASVLGLVVEAPG